MDDLHKLKVKLADEKLVLKRKARDAALDALTAAQRKGAGPDERQKLVRRYDASEEALEKAENGARRARRKALGLPGKAQLSEAELTMLDIGMAEELRRLGHGR